jgi:predicted lipid-binding transport protein (Tim44 family)
MPEQKVIGVLIAIGLIVVAGIFWMLDDDKDAADKPESATVAVAPPGSSADSEDVARTGAVPTEPPAKPQAALPADQSGEEWSGKILVSKRPVQVLSAPDASASAMYGFPAGRPFRAISREAGFVRIQDVKSGASGWIEEAALAPPPPRPVATPKSQPTNPRAKPVTSAKSKPSNRNEKSAQAVAPADAEPEPTQRKRRGLFGGEGGGLFGGLFGGR